MISSRPLADEVKVYQLSVARTPTGSNRTRVLVETTDGSLTQLEVAAQLAYGKQDVKPTHQLKVRGHAEWDFAITEFEVNGQVLRPLGAPRYPGVRRAEWTVMDVRDVSLDGPNQGGSGSGS